MPHFLLNPLDRLPTRPELRHCRVMVYMLATTIHSNALAVNLDISMMVSDSGVLTFEGEQIMLLPVASKANKD